MHFNPTRIARAVCIAALGATLYATTGPAFTQPYGEGGRGHGPRAAQMTEAERAQMRERMQARMKERLDRLATRLDIKPSQQSAWASYRQTIESLWTQDRPQRPARDADAATLLRFRAEMAQRQAKHLLTVADATASLQQVLEPEQRKVLDDIARSFGRHGRRGGHHADHHGPRGGGERGRG